jgi:hypothetical protein
MNSEATNGFDARGSAGRRGASEALWQAMKCAVIILVALPAFAQYGGSTGMGSSTPSYGHGAAIGVGVGAAAGGVAGVYFLTHRSSRVTGCVVQGDGGLALTDDKSKRTFQLVEGSADVRSGERVELKGKIRKNESGNPRFQVKSVAKNLGECREQASAAAEIPAVAQPIEK